MVLRLEDFEKRIWEEEKLFLLIKNNAIKFGDYYPHQLSILNINKL